MGEIKTTIPISADGTVVLTAELRETLGLKGSSLLEATVETGRLVLRPLPTIAPVPSALEAMRLKNLQTPMQFIKGVGPKLAELLAKRGVTTVEDALYLLPHRYEDRRQVTPIGQLQHGSTEVICATVQSAGETLTKGGRRIFEALVSDGSGQLLLKWFRGNTTFLKRIWQPGKTGIFTGEVTRFGFQPEMHHPDADWLAQGEDLAAAMARDTVNFGRLVPVYPLTEGLHQRTMRKVMKAVTETYATALTDCVPEAISRQHNLLPLAQAVTEVHSPRDGELERLNCGDFPARRTLVFDELFFLELGLAMRRQGMTMEQGIAFAVTHRYTKPLLQMLPFQLTTAQRRVLSEIKNDMMLPHPMHRLVQGDVGSGKTLVALLAALVAVENGYQVAIMAPTEILAEQHYLNIHCWCEQLGLQVALLTSSLKGKAREMAMSQIASGAAHIVIGTHAVIQDKVEFQRLGLGIVDEQHRFGVLQRGILRHKGENPDILVMTATPIPRTLAMTVFGDLALSVIDELPPGRQPIETRVAHESRRAQVYGIIREEVAKGHQVYLICPLVAESEKSELKAATQHAEHLGEVFPELRIGLLHGRLKPEEKEAVMAAFKQRETDLLVATTVIEVGIDVPNATVMVVEHAERFGLSQLHQLRGRVGRGAGKSRCILMAADQLSEDGEKRLKVMAATSDGFRIAEADLEIRGPGDFLGTRQAGLPEFRVADILRDGRLLEEARQEAFALLETDPGLKNPAHAALRAELLRRWGGRLELAGIA